MGSEAVAEEAPDAPDGVHGVPARVVEGAAGRGLTGARLALPRTWSDGTRSFVFSPLTFIARLVPLVPRPRVNLFRYHGVLAPAAARRPEVVVLAEPPDGAARPRLGASSCQARRGSRNLDWATLLRRTFGLEVLICAS